jgi:hypothetical protein
MAQIKFEGNLNKNWTAFSTIVGTVGADTNYQIQNRGADTLVLLESSDTPSNDTQAGVMVLPYATCIYKKGTQDLYLRAFNRNCSVNVTSED